MMLLGDAPVAAVDDLTGTFAGLMDLYERNYISLRRLLTSLPPPGVTRVSTIPGGLDLYARVIERFPYTTELCLTYRFQRDGGPVEEPDLRIRIYHDARQAEVMSAHLRHWPSFLAGEATQLHARWHVNRFLYKWLSYCLHQGHRFA